MGKGSMKGTARGKEKAQRQGEAMTTAEHQQREEQIMCELRETRRERDELAQRVAFLEAHLANGSPRSDVGATGDGNTAVQYLTRRVSDLEREESKWRLERKSAEDRISELLVMAARTLEDDSHVNVKVANLYPRSAGALDDDGHVKVASTYPRSRKVTRPTM